MKPNAGWKGATDAVVASYTYTAFELLQSKIAELDFPGIDGAGQLISLAASDTVQIENLTGGMYRLNVLGGLGGTLTVLTDLPEAPANGEALFALCQIPSDVGIYLAPLADTWVNSAANWVNDCAFQQWSPHCTTVGVFVTKELTIKKLASYSMKFEGTSGQQIAVLSPENYRAGDGDVYNRLLVLSHDFNGETAYLELQGRVRGGDDWMGFTVRG